MKKHLILSVLLIVGLAGLAYADDEMKMDSKKMLSAAKAKIVGTSADAKVQGTAKFHNTANGLKVNIILKDAEPGKHGIHIHEIGSCEDEGKAAGGHYNPHGTEHGFLPENGLQAAHVGDMGNIEVDENGNGTLSIDLPGLTVDGENGVLGRSVILHEKEDDFGQPTGNAGARQACGVIGVAKAWDSSFKGTMKADKQEIIQKQKKGSY